MIKNKQGIELSVNMLVIIIISLVILGLGVKLLFNLMGGAVETYEELDQQTKDELNRLLDLGKKVALPYNNKVLGSGETHDFGLGIRNIGDTGTFSVVIECSKIIPKNPSEEDVLCGATFPINDWFLFIGGPYELKKNEHEEIKIGVNPPKDAEKGQYIFTVKVLKDSDQYGNKQKIDLTIK